MRDGAPEAALRLEEGVQARVGKSVPRDWAFLAMVHHRMGNSARARRWLDEFRDYRPDPAARDAFWSELEVRLLRSEAEAVVLWAPIFPVDPFARLERLPEGLLRLLQACVRCLQFHPEETAGPDGDGR